MRYKEFKVENDYPKIYYFLKDSGFSESFIKKLRKEPFSILKNDEIATTRSALKKGDNLKICLDISPKSNFQSNDVPLDIVYEDEYLLVVNKPSGLSASPSRSHYLENLAGSILGYMQQKDPSFVLRMTNRLDKGTAGIIIIAKDILTYNKIKNVEKTYYAICKGLIEKPICIDKPIETINKDGINQLKRIVSKNGKPAKTFVTPVKKLHDSTLIKLQLENGRTHQIRVHLSHINHPLIGDEVYGEKSTLISHTALVCKKVNFNHPWTNKKLSFEIEYPNDFKPLLVYLEN